MARDDTPRSYINTLATAATRGDEEIEKFGKKFDMGTVRQKIGNRRKSVIEAREANDTGTQPWQRG